MSLRKTRIRPLAAVLLLAVAPAVSTTPPVAHAIVAENPPSYCQGVGDDPIVNPGQKTPVILVHGLGGKATDWTGNDRPYKATINTIPRAVVIQSFNYDVLQGDEPNANMQWISHPASGPRLARLITCVGQWSAENGGPGKVILVGHSMGGLMIRWAYGRTIGEHAVSDYFGKVITIATPNKGSFAWGTFTVPFLKPGSKELKSLPTYAKDLPVYAIAGNIRDAYYNWGGGRAYKTKQRNDDEWVGVNSALAVANKSPVYGGGAKTFSCEQRYERRPLVTHKGKVKVWGPENKVESNLFCAHTEQLKSQIIADDVKREIELYTSALPAPSAPNWPLDPAANRPYTIGGLEVGLIHPTEWYNVSVDPSTMNSLRAVHRLSPPPPCNSEPCSDTNRGQFWLVDSNVFPPGGIIDAFTSSGAVDHILTGPFNIGGRWSTLSFTVLQPEGPIQVWCFLEGGSHACMSYGSPIPRPTDSPLRFMLDNVIWVE